MTTHALAKLLLDGPDVPVIIATGSVEDELEVVDHVCIRPLDYDIGYKSNGLDKHTIVAELG